MIWCAFSTACTTWATRSERSGMSARPWRTTPPACWSSHSPTTGWNTISHRWGGCSMRHPPWSARRPRWRRRSALHWARSPAKRGCARWPAKAAFRDSAARRRRRSIWCWRRGNRCSPHRVRDAAFLMPLRRDGPRQPSPSPPVLPDFLADHAAHPRFLLGDRNDAAFRRAAGDFEHQLGADAFLEFIAVLDRHHEGARPADDAVFVIEVEIVDIHGRIGRLLHHDRQTVDGDALPDCGVAGAGDGGAVVFGAVTPNINDAAQAAIRVLLEQRHREID